LKSGEWFFRFVILDHLFHKLIHLNYWSEILRPPLYKAARYLRAKNAEYSIKKIRILTIMAATIPIVES
jgi:hypothetical protein